MSRHNRITSRCKRARNANDQHRAMAAAKRAARRSISHTIR